MAEWDIVCRGLDTIRKEEIRALLPLQMLPVLYTLLADPSGWDEQVYKGTNLHATKSCFASSRRKPDWRRKRRTGHTSWYTHRARPCHLRAPMPDSH